MAGHKESVEVELFPAGHGDSILVRCRTEGGPFNILIDGGVRATYAEHLASRFAEMSAGGEQLDLVIVTHIDTDHIGGILELCKANGPSASPAVIKVGEIWHNGYRHLGLEGRNATELEKQAVLSQIPSLGDSRGIEENISVREAQTLASLITKNGYRWNQAFEGKAVLAGTRAVLRPGATLTILSPRAEELGKLARLWKRGLATKGVHQAVVCAEFEAAFELEMPQISDAESTEEAPISFSDSDEVPDPSTFREDTSAINGSSIAFLLEFAGKRLLFLADALPSVIVDELRKRPDAGQPDEVDLVKVSHHGSRHNTSPQLLEVVTSRIYVISTDGTKHDHPHAEALLRIAGSTGPGSSLVFNYPTATANRMNQPSVMEKYGHTVTVGTGREPIVLAFGGEDQGGK
jgi:hypothetical protein